MIYGWHAEAQGWSERESAGFSDLLLMVPSREPTDHDTEKGERIKISNNLVKTSDGFFLDFFKTNVLRQFSAMYYMFIDWFILCNIINYTGRLIVIRYPEFKKKIRIAAVNLKEGARIILDAGHDCTCAPG